MKKSVFAAFVLLLLLSACAPASPASEPMPEKPAEAVMESPTPEMMDEVEDAANPDAAASPMPNAPAWFSASLIDVNTDTAFTVQDFKGKVVLVETLAMWCSTCKKQQGELKALRAVMGENADLVSIGLDIDPNENAADLKAYTQANGFDWVYAVAPAEVTREIGSLYGDQFLNPPSAPMLIIDRKGQAHPLPFGLKSAAALMEALEPFIQEEM